MKILKILLLTGIAVMFLVSCSTIRVSTDRDKAIDFTKYKTYEYYGWADESDKIMNEFDKNRIEHAFGDEFAKRGLENVESGGDLVVVLFIVVEQKTEQRAETTGSSGMYGGGYYGGYYGYGPEWGWGSTYSTTTVRTYEYEIGTLVIDVFDRTKEQLIWESIGRGTVDEDPMTREKKTPKNVAQIMKEYPVHPIEKK
jgi:hypothetical protein